MKILVVEDNKKLARFLVRALSEEGWVIDQVESGTVALEQAAATAYDLILLDWMLPDLDGLAVCRQLRASGARMPVMMLTARAEIQERIAGLDAGADDYLPKPFDLGELLARCRALVRRAGGEETMVVVGPLQLDRAERRATLDGKRVELTPREFALVVLLARRVGRAVSRMEILQKVWETSFDPGSNVVEVHVKNLREKLGDHAKMIETVRGVGYRLATPAAPPPAPALPAQ